MQKIFIGSIQKYSRTASLKKLLTKLKMLKTVKIEYPNAPLLTKGFAIVRIKFKKNKDLKELIQKNLRFRGQLLHITEYLEKEGIEQRDKELGRRKIYVSKIPAVMKNQELKSLFMEFGEVETAYICKEKSQSSFMYGFVTFFDTKCAEHCVENGTVKFQGGELKVKKFTPTKCLKKDNGVVPDGKKKIDSRDRGKLTEKKILTNSRPRRLEQHRMVEQSPQFLMDKTFFVPKKRRIVPPIDFSIKDGLGEILKVTTRNPYKKGNLRFNRKFGGKKYRKVEVEYKQYDFENCYSPRTQTSVNRSFARKSQGYWRKNYGEDRSYEQIKYRKNFLY